MGFESAETLRDGEGRQYHIGLAPGEVAKNVMLVGDPDRAERVSSRFDNVRLRRAHREFVTYTGTYKNLEMSVMGTGIGCDNTEIALTELLQCERHPTLIRVGSCGALQEPIDLADVVISTGSVRLESTSLGFVDESYPAVAHHEVVLAVISATKSLGLPIHAGLTACASGFYGWQSRKNPIFEPRFLDLPDRLASWGVMNYEMETSTLFTLASLAGVRAGAVCGVFANRPKNCFVDDDQKKLAETRAIDCGLRAFEILASMGEGPYTIDYTS